MTVSAGQRLGSYEILAPLGAGGMGEVWKARDSRLGRDVAIKVIPEDLAAEPERLRRFEREARAASALSHPNIVTIFEVARVDSTSLLVMELVEGRTLREVLAGAALPFRKILSIAPQIAEGLARAHASGIVHRDLKPENVMVTPDGLVKILDFGLAKLTRPHLESGGTPASTVSAGTQPGIAMGTVSYMSPEQASGHPVDFRSDQFALGSMLYEMAAGKPAFRKPTAAQTLAAIIEDEPEPVATAAPRTPAPLRWVIERCLAKEPKGRYASTEDLARELADLRDHVSDLSGGAAVEIEPPRRRPRWRAIAASLMALAALTGSYFVGRRVQLAQTSEPQFHQLTFRGAGISTARFTPDGQSVVFSSETEGRPPELYTVRLDSPEVRPLGLPPGHIVSISRTGEMAILLLRPFALLPRIGHIAFEQASFRDLSLFEGTLAIAPLAGGAPREVLENVTFADMSPDGATVAVAHRIANRARIEFPIGKPIFEEDIALNHPRLSPDAHRLAFKDWGWLYVDSGGKHKRLLPEIVESAWSRSGGEIWYTSTFLSETEVRAITPEGRDRRVCVLPSDFVLYDIASDGRVLLGRLIESTKMLGTFPGETAPRDLSYFDHSIAQDLSASGDALLFTDVTPNVGAGGSTIYLRKTDGSAPKRLATDSVGDSVLSPDGSLVLTGTGDAPEANHVLIPTGAGQTRSVNTQGIEVSDTELHRNGILPDGSAVYFVGYSPGRARRVWVQDLRGGKPHPITPENTTRPVLIGNGRGICARGPDFVWRIYPTSGSAEATPVLGLLPGEEPFRSTPDGKWLYVRGADELRPGETLMTTRVYRLDPLTGRRELWKEIPAEKSNAGGAIESILFSGDGKICVWTHLRYSTELVVVEGLK